MFGTVIVTHFGAEVGHTTSAALTVMGKLPLLVVRVMMWTFTVLQKVPTSALVRFHLEHQSSYLHFAFVPFCPDVSHLTGR